MRLSPLKTIGILAFMVLALAWVLLWYVQVATRENPDFDGALNLNVSASLVEGRGYGSFYETYALFPIETQTNGPLVVPAALSMALFGHEPFGLQVVNLAYVFALWITVLLLMRRIGASWAWSLFTSLAVLQVPGMAQFAMSGYGEVAALAWGLAAALVLGSGIETLRAFRVVAGGALLGASFLTKTVALIWFPGVAGVFLLVLAHRHGARTAVRMALWGALGGMAALCAWELYRLVSLGGFAGWIDWWLTQYEEIRRQAGVREHYADTDSNWTKLDVHGSALASYLGLQGPMLVVLGLLWIALSATAVWRLRKTSLALYLLLFSAGTAVAYLFWWLLVTPTEMMWLRRVMLGLTLAQLAMAIAAVALARSGQLGRLAAVACFACMLAVSWQGQLLFGRPDRSDAAAAERALADAVRGLPHDAITFGSGWWQAPVIALLSGRVMHNEEAWTQQRLDEAGRAGFLVVDAYALNLGTHLHWRLGWRCDCVPVYVGSGGRIFRIDVLYESEAASQVQRRRIGPESDGFVRGFTVEDDGGFRWAEQESRLEFDPPVQPSRWILALSVPPPELFGRPAGSTLILELERPGCATETRSLGPGEHSLLLEVPCQTPVSALILRASHHMDLEKIKPDTRHLSFMFKSLEFYPESSRRPRGDFSP
jgi:hypothetical protein